MVKRIDSNAQRLKRHKRVRGKISGTPERPRLAVYRSNAHISAQIIDDVNGVTMEAWLYFMNKKKLALTYTPYGAKANQTHNTIRG